MTGVARKPVTPREPVRYTAVEQEIVQEDERSLLPPPDEAAKQSFSFFHQIPSRDEDFQQEVRELQRQIKPLTPVSKSGWLPSYLRSIVLLSFTIAYIVLAALLGGLYRDSQQHQGLARNNENWHYIFKYAPTAGML